MKWTVPQVEENKDYRGLQRKGREVSAVDSPINSRNLQSFSVSCTSGTVHFIHSFHLRSFSNFASSLVALTISTAEEVDETLAVRYIMTRCKNLVENVFQLSYNLRSIRRKKNIPVGNSYLQNSSEYISPEAFNPKVCLERLKLLECHDFQNSRFYLKKGRITIKENKSNHLPKKYLLQLFCTIILLITPLLYWRGYYQINGIGLIKKYAENHPFQNFYSKFSESFWKQFKYNQQKTEREDRKLVFEVVNTNSTLMNDNFEIRQLVKDFLIEIKKKNKIHNSDKSPQSFIEEQCKRDVYDNPYIRKKKFYNATFHDLTNLTDYALESQGAKIVTVFNTELYGIITVKYLNINLWPELSHFLMKNLKCFSSNGPNSILMPWKKPGDCWAFKGSHGRVEIKLSDEIKVTAITVEHIPKEITAKGNMHSAPKKFSLLGVQEFGDNSKRTFLGSYQYDISGPAAQTFLIQPKIEIPFRSVEVAIESNHGNEKYTCIYKIRIHGHK